MPPWDRLRQEPMQQQARAAPFGAHHMPAGCMESLADLSQPQKFSMRAKSAFCSRP